MSSSYYKNSRKPSMEKESLWIIGDGEPRIYEDIPPFMYDIKGLREDFGEKSDELMEEDIERLCKQYEIFSGKWVFETDRDNVDKHWNNTVELLEDKEIYFAKVSTAAYPEKTNRNAGKEILAPEKHFILTYTEDYREKDDVMEVGELLVGKGMEEIGYKRDILTALGIHQEREGIEYFKYKIE